MIFRFSICVAASFALSAPAAASSVQEDAAAAAEKVVLKVQEAVFEDAFKHLTTPVCPKCESVEKTFDKVFPSRTKSK
jgi:hypothetical protein